MTVPFKVVARDGEPFKVMLQGADMLAPILEAAQQAEASAEASAAAALAAVEPMQDSLRTGAGRGLYAVKKALTNPLFQFVGIVLIGDSITAGMSASGADAGFPGSYPERAGTLADPRNNATSPSWANLLHAYLGREYFVDTSVTASAWPGSPSGFATFEYSRTVDLFPDGGDFRTSNVGGSGGAWGVIVTSSALKGAYIQANNIVSGDNYRITFPFTGSEFDLCFAAQSNGARYELIIDSVVEGTYSTQTGDTGLPVSFGNFRTHDLGGFVKDATIEIRAVPGDGARDNLRIEAIRSKRKLRVTNQGIVGSDAIGWYQNLLADAHRAGDIFALVQLGTNDRALVPADYGTPTGADTLRRYLTAIVVTLRSTGIEPILACANAVANEATYFTMADARGAIAAAADALGCDMVDHYGPSAARLATGDASWLEPGSDAVHPSDAGHLDIFQRWKSFIDASMAR